MATVKKRSLDFTRYLNVPQDDLKEVYAWVRRQDAATLSYFLNTFNNWQWHLDKKAALDEALTHKSRRANMGVKFMRACASLILAVVAPILVWLVINCLAGHHSRFW